jgi:hypothetical protein
MEALSKKQLVSLKAVIKGLAAESKVIRKNLIHPKVDVERANGWRTKRHVGNYARLHLLAYAFMRGFKYEQVERLLVVDENHKSRQNYDAERLAEIILKICEFHGTIEVKWNKELNSKVIKSWLLGSENIIFVWTPSKNNAKKENV